MSLEDKLYPFLSFYDRLPRGVKYAIGATYRQLPEKFRRGEHYREFRLLAEGGEQWPRRQIEEYQFQELKRTLSHAARHCPFYRDHFGAFGFDVEKFSSFDDLQQVPTMTKADLLQNRDRMLSE